MEANLLDSSRLSQRLTGLGVKREDGSAAKVWTDLDAGQTGNCAGSLEGLEEKGRLPGEEPALGTTQTCTHQHSMHIHGSPTHARASTCTHAFCTQVHVALSVFTCTHGACPNPLFLSPSLQEPGQQLAQLPTAGPGD